MAAGLPIISTDKGAIIESVINGYNGYIVKPKSPKQITKKIIKLINDKNLLSHMSSNSLNIYNKKFTEQRLVDNFSSVFDKVLKWKMINIYKIEKYKSIFRMIIR